MRTDNGIYVVEMVKSEDRIDAARGLSLVLGVCLRIIKQANTFILFD